MDQLNEAKNLGDEVEARKTEQGLIGAAPALHSALMDARQFFVPQKGGPSIRKDTLLAKIDAALALVNKPDTNSANLDHPAHGQASKTEVQK